MPDVPFDFIAFFLHLWLFQSSFSYEILCCNAMYAHNNA